VHLFISKSITINKHYLSVTNRTRWQEEKQEQGVYHLNVSLYKFLPSSLCGEIEKKYELILMGTLGAQNRIIYWLSWDKL